MTSLMWSQNPLPNFQCCYPFILLAGMIWAKLNLVSQWAPREPEWDFSFYMPSNSVGLSKLIWGTFWCLLLWCFWQDSTDFFLFDLFLKPFQALWFCQIIASQETRFLHFLMQMCIVKLTATCVRVLLAVLDNTVAAISEAFSLTIFQLSSRVELTNCTSLLFSMKISQQSSRVSYIFCQLFRIKFPLVIFLVHYNKVQFSILIYFKM